MLKLLSWFTGRSNNFLSEKLLHIEDDYYSKSKVIRKELNSISNYYYFN
ncbi:MAG: hypothetical protein ACJ0G3_01810 [Dehalococcoidia bacterium]